MTQARVNAETSMMGNLETWPLSEILLWLNKTGRTAMVRVGVGLDAGIIFVSNGFAYRCEWGPYMGQQALFGLLCLERGFFFLIQRDVPQPRQNVFVPTEHLLLQFAVAQDERMLAASA